MIDVIFKRVGRFGSEGEGQPPAPAPLTVPTTDLATLRSRIRSYADPYMLSTDFHVVIDPASGQGSINIASWSAGTFVLRPSAQALPEQELTA